MFFEGKNRFELRAKKILRELKRLVGKQMELIRCYSVKQDVWVLYLDLYFVIVELLVDF